MLYLKYNCSQKDYTSNENQSFFFFFFFKYRFYWPKFLLRPHSKDSFDYSDSSLYSFFFFFIYFLSYRRNVTFQNVRF